jgi:hypothetical protein
VATAADVTALARMEQSADTGGGRSPPAKSPRRVVGVRAASELGNVIGLIEVEYLPPQ